MTAILVFGGLGFLGRAIVDQLLAHGLDAAPAPPRRELDLTLAQPDEVTRVIGHARVVVNATGRTSGEETQLWADNVEASRVLAQAARARGDCRLVQIGSLAEYGLGDGAPFREDGPQQPITAYGRAKLAATGELLADAALESVVLRVANPLGPGQPPGTLPGQVMAQVRDDPEAELTLGRLDGARDYVSSHDVGSAVVAAVLARRLPAQRVINIGSGVATPVRELVRLMRRQLGHVGRLVERPVTGSTTSATVEHPLVADVSRARHELGWRCAHDTTEAVRRMVGGRG